MNTPTLPQTGVGRHWLAEFYACNASTLQEVAKVEQILLDAAAVMGAQVVSTHFHQFSPWGVSGFIIIQESHLSIHTWPEYGYAAVDVFSCDLNLRAELGIAHLEEALEASQKYTFHLERGLPPMVKK